MGAACRFPPPMPADPASAPSPQPIEGLSPSQRALLRIVCWVAWADGDFAAEERELIDKLVQRLLPADTGANAAASAAALATEPPTAAELAPLVAALEGSDQRQLAVKLALQMVSVNRRPGDDAAINPAEKGAYRQLALVAAVEGGHQRRQLLGRGGLDGQGCFRCRRSGPGINRQQASAEFVEQLPLLRGEVAVGPGHPADDAQQSPLGRAQAIKRRLKRCGR